MAFHGFARRGPQGSRWTGRVEVISDKLMDPLGWRKPSRVFSNSMSDLFHENLPFAQIDRVVASMLISCLHETKGGHTFITLTKRSRLLLSYANSARSRAHDIARAGAQMMEDGDAWHDVLYSYVHEHGISHPLLWFGVSVEDQHYAEARLPDLVRSEVWLRLISCEPLLGGVDVSPWLHRGVDAARMGDRDHDAVSWVICGGEAGRGSRVFDVSWARALRDQCKAAKVPFFMKQLGDYAMERDDAGRVGFFQRSPRIETDHGGAYYIPSSGLVRTKKGGNVDEWPEDLRVRQFPEVRS